MDTLVSSQFRHQKAQLCSELIVKSQDHLLGAIVDSTACSLGRVTREADICESASFSLPVQSFRSRTRTFGWRIAIGAWPKLATHEPALASPKPCASCDDVGFFHLLWQAFSRTVANIFNNSVNLQKPVNMDSPRLTTST
jgi:hypothetical protein